MTRTPEQIHEDYKTFRGRCKELCDQAVAADPTLRLVRGHYFCIVWGTNEQHWWTVRPDGTIYDPSARQFPCNGQGIYEEFDGIVECADCGKTMQEEQAYIEGRYAFCKDTNCYGRFVGVC